MNHEVFSMVLTRMMTSWSCIAGPDCVGMGWLASTTMRMLHGLENKINSAQRCLRYRISSVRSFTPEYSAKDTAKGRDLHEDGKGIAGVKTRRFR